MINLLNTYIISFLHPFKYARYVGGQEHFEDWYQQGVRRLNLTEAIGVSWVFVIVSVIYQILLFQMGAHFTRIFELIALPQKSLTFIVFLFLEVLIFPFTCLLTVMFWEFTLKLVTRMIGHEVVNYQDYEQVIIDSFSSNLLYAIPIIGSTAAKIFWPLYVFAGMRHILKLTNLQIISMLWVLWSVYAMIVIAIGLSVYLALGHVMDLFV